VATLTGRWEAAKEGNTRRTFLTEERSLGNKGKDLFQPDFPSLN
jgi:hypothetical protein